jgi:N-acetylglutamate synthase-like GNAT family acetyltransferase
MEEITYINIKPWHYREIKILINKTWQVNKFISNKLLLDCVLDAYVRLCLKDATYGKLAIKNNEIIGIILGQANKQNKIFNPMLQNIKIIENILVAAFAITEQDLNNLQELNKINIAYKELIKDKKKLFDGTVVFLAVSKKARGYGVGKKLVEDLKSYLKEKEVKNIYVYTDTSCNYAFYDSQGFKRIDSTNVSIQTETIKADMQVFMYSYKV